MTQQDAPAFSPDERRLLEEAAAAIVRRRLAVPAMLFLETMTPMNLVTASMLAVLSPVLSVAMPRRRIEQVAVLLERRTALPELVRLVDEAEERRRREERQERDERRRERDARRQARRDAAGRRS